MEYISIPWKKILGRAGFEQLPVEAKISEAHALPSEIAGPSLLPLLFRYLKKIMVALPKEWILTLCVLFTNISIYN